VYKSPSNAISLEHFRKAVLRFCMRTFELLASGKITESRDKLFSSALSLLGIMTSADNLPNKSALARSKRDTKISDIPTMLGLSPTPLADHHHAPSATASPSSASSTSTSAVAGVATSNDNNNDNDEGTGESRQQLQEEVDAAKAEILANLLRWQVPPTSDANSSSASTVPTSSSSSSSSSSNAATKTPSSSTISASASASTTCQVVRRRRRAAGGT